MLGVELWRLRVNHIATFIEPAALHSRRENADCEVTGRDRIKHECDVAAVLRAQAASHPDAKGRRGESLDLGKIRPLVCGDGLGSIVQCSVPGGDISSLENHTGHC